MVYRGEYVRHWKGISKFHVRLLFFELLFELYHHIKDTFLTTFHP